MAYYPMSILDILDEMESKHYVAFDHRVGGWVVVLKLDRRVVSRPRSANAADNLRISFDRSLKNGYNPLYESVKFDQI